MSKLTTLRDAIATLIRDGDTIAIEGFTHLICFAAAHEIIRQRKRELTVCRMTPDLILSLAEIRSLLSRLGGPT